MKKQSEKKETRFTIYTYCEVPFGGSFSEFDIKQTFTSSNKDYNVLLNEVVYFVKKSLEFPEINFGEGQVLSIQICFESFINYDKISYFYKKLLKKLFKIDFFEIDCTEEVFFKLDEECKNNICCPSISFDYHTRNKTIKEVLG
jgi:hypothetical protein